jgi:hypothetical protein
VIRLHIRGSLPVELLNTFLERAPSSARKDAMRLVGLTIRLTRCRRETFQRAFEPKFISIASGRQPGENARGPIGRQRAFDQESEVGSEEPEQAHIPRMAPVADGTLPPR